jgi:hypothetical protein
MPPPTTVVEIAGTIRHFKGRAHARSSSLPPLHVFQQLQGVLIGDSADGMTEPELSQIVGTSCSL